MAVLRGFAVLLALQIAGETIVRLTALPIPGPVVGLVLLAVALVSYRPIGEVVEPAGRLLLQHLSLLFVPAGVGVISHLERLEGRYLAILAVLGTSTLIGLAVTAWTLQALGPPAVQHRRDGDSDEPPEHGTAESSGAPPATREDDENSNASRVTGDG